MIKFIYIVSILTLLVISSIKCQDTYEYIAEGSDRTSISSFNLSNGLEFSIFESLGSWKDNFGNYGKNSCKGVIEKKINNKISLIIMCEIVDRKGYMTWTLNKREGELGSGVGSFEIVDTTIPKKELYIGIKCKYAVQYLDELNFYKNKCVITKELAEVFEMISK